MNQLFSGWSPALPQRMLVQLAAKPCVMLSPAAAIFAGSGGAVVLVVDDVLDVVEVLLVELVVEDVLELVDVVELVVDEVEVVVDVDDVLELEVLEVVLVDEVEDVLVVLLVDVVVTLVLVVVVDTPPGQMPSRTGRTTLKSVLPWFTTSPSDPNCTL